MKSLVSLYVVPATANGGEVTKGVWRLAMQNCVLGNGVPLDHVVDDDYDKLTVCLGKWSSHLIIKQLLLVCVQRMGEARR